MTSESHPAAVGVTRRPAPPRPAAAPCVPAAPVTYVPDEYDPRHAPAAAAVTPGQYGLVHPTPRSGRGVWIALLLIVAAVVGFVGWRVTHTGTKAQSGTAYTSAAGHFSARFPAQPVEMSRTERDGASRLTMHLAVVAGQGSVGEMEIAGHLGKNVSALAKRMAAGTGSDDITLSSVKHFSFHGMRAMQGNYLQETTGELVTVLVAVQSKRRLYLVLGSTGPTFDVLKDSFAVAP